MEEHYTSDSMRASDDYQMAPGSYSGGFYNEDITKMNKITLCVTTVDNLLAAIGGLRMALEAQRQGLEVGDIWILTTGTPSRDTVSGWATCDLIEAMRVHDLTLDGLRRYAYVVAAGVGLEEVLETIRHRYAALVMPRQETQRERIAAGVLARIWMESIQEEIEEHYKSDVISYNTPLTRRLYNEGVIEAEEVTRLLAGAGNK
jgi:hypothetical protein